jgi:hypothetical protein
MASQPANTLIKVQYTVRSYRDGVRHEAVLALLGGVLGGGMRELKMSVPGDETLMTETRETLGAGESAILNTSLTVGRTTGLPVVRHFKTVTTAKDAVDNGTFGANLGVPKRIGRDWFFYKKDAFLTDDLHQQLRDVN